MTQSKTFKTLSVCAVAVIAAAALAVPAWATDAGESKDSGVVGKKQGRSLASLAPLASRSQGELMLSTVKTTNPRFLGGEESKRRLPVRITGVCRSGFGATYVSTQSPAYEDCLDPRAARSGDVDTYWGQAQRQAGIGILVGK